MDFAEGGKIDTVLYSAAIGALSSTARAGTGIAIRINPTTNIAMLQNAGGLPDTSNRSRPFVSLMRRHISSHQNPAETIAAVWRCQDRAAGQIPTINTSAAAGNAALMMVSQARQTIRPIRRCIPPPTPLK
jgi:hypothetical protein